MKLYSTPGFSVTDHMRLCLSSERSPTSTSDEALYLHAFPSKEIRGPVAGKERQNQVD